MLCWAQHDWPNAKGTYLTYLLSGLGRALKIVAGLDAGPAQLDIGEQWLLLGITCGYWACAGLSMTGRMLKGLTDGLQR